MQRRTPRDTTNPRSRTRNVSVLALAALIASLSAGTALAYPPVLDPPTGAHLGAHVATRGRESNVDAFRRFERMAGSKIRIHHTYYKWNSPMPMSLQDWDRRTGHIPFLNWAALRTDGSFVPWRVIASGAQDRWIAQRARAFKRFGKPIYLTFQHEPENNVPRFGTPQEFAAAFRRIVRVFREERVKNVAFVWTMMAWSFDPRNDPAAYYPGDRFVDFIGSDGYNWYGLRPGERWRPFAEIFEATDRWAERHDKPWMIVEFGSAEDPDVEGRKARWIRNVLPAARRWPDLAGVIYFDSIKAGKHWSVDSSGSSVRAFRDLAAAAHPRR